MSMSPESIFDWLAGMAGDPMSLAIALALATLLTEDGAVVAGSLLVGGGLASPFIVIGALIIGIVGGDIALYLLGWTARGIRWLRRRLPIKKARALKHWLNGREAAVLFFSRFLPGTRLVTYLTFGFLRLSLVRFVSVMTVACVIWVGAIVFFISQIQIAIASVGGGLPATLIAAALAVVVIVFGPRLIGRSKAATSLADADTAEGGARDA